MFLFYDLPAADRSRNAVAAKRWLKEAGRNGFPGSQIGVRAIRGWEKTGILPDRSGNIEDLDFGSDADVEEED